MGSSKKSSDRDKRKRSRSREREKARERNRSRERGRSKERESGRTGRDVKERSRAKIKDHSRKERESEKKKESSSHRSRTHDEDDSSRRRQKEEQRSTKKEKYPPRRKRSRSGSHSESDEGVKRKRSADRESPSSEKKSDATNTTQDSSVPIINEPVVKSSGDVTSLSIEKANQLRASLGMKPLDVGSQADTEKQDQVQRDGDKPGGGAEEEEVETATKKKDVHVPAQNIGTIKTAEKVKDKIETARETRRIAKKLTSMRTLGEGDDEGSKSGRIDDASDWVDKMKRLQKEKEIAQKREALLVEMDEEFGIADLLSEELMKDKERAYSSKHLKGLTVEHKTDVIKEGRQVVLTLKDTKILDNEDDVLVNVNIVDDERASKNVEIRKGKPSYNPYDAEDEVDEWGNLTKQAVLKKYDEEIEGAKKRSFALGSQGDVDTSDQRERALVRQRLQAKEISLQLAPSLAATEYYTSEEMVQFKKPKKKRKIRKKEQLKPDDIIPLPEELRDHGSRDHGSRLRPKEATPSGEEGEAMDIEPPTIVASETNLKDEDDSSVDSALTRTRRLLKRANSEVSGAAKVVSMLESIPKIEMETSEPSAESDTIVLDITSEFCRQVGEDEGGIEPARHTSTSHQDEQYDEDEMELEETAGEDIGGWTEIHHSAREKKSKPKADDLYQEAEPIVASGITAALQVATRKGFIEASKPKKEPGEVTKVYTDAKRDVEYERQKEKEREREVARFDREANFPEIRGYKPKVNIEYVDDKGRNLSTKEAFRFLSHKFHGRGSGKKKTERRLKKLQSEQFMKRSNSVDTPLNTLTMLQTKQKASQTPYILLSGGAQSLLAPDIAKKK